MMKVQKLLFFIFVCFITLSCNRDEVEEVSCETFDETNVYEKDVKRILNVSCANAIGCHGSGSTKTSDYSSYQDFKENNGPDQFIQRITQKGNMPPLYEENGIITPPLTDLEILTLQCWAQGGYLEN